MLVKPQIMIRTHLLTFLALFLFIQASGQVGISTTTPQGALDVTSTDGGVLLPRFALASTTDVATVTNPNGGALAISTIVFNDGTGGLSPAGFYYWSGTNWTPLFDNSPRVYVGKAIINGAGNITITGIPFQPRHVSFTAYSNIESYNVNASGATNNNGKDNSFGGMKGFARQDAGSITQQVINGGGSGNSINSISRYASDSHCIGVRYGNQNGGSNGINSAVLTSFNPDGFTLNVDSYVNNENLVIIYEAHRY